MSPYRIPAPPKPEPKPWRCRLGFHKTVMVEDHDYWHIEQCVRCGRREHVTFFADHTIRDTE